MRRSCLHVVWSLMWLSVASAQDASNPSERTLLDRIYFDVSATSLSADARATLDAVATVLHREAETVVHLAGHTDPSGRRWANVLLSRARAEAAKLRAQTGPQNVRKRRALINIARSSI